MSERNVILNQTSKTGRVHKGNTLPLQSLRLIAAPDPKDDLSEEEVVAFCKQNRYSPDMIRQLIEYVKNL